MTDTASGNLDITVNFGYLIGFESDIKTFDFRCTESFFDDGFYHRKNKLCTGNLDRNMTFN